MVLCVHVLSLREGREGLCKVGNGLNVSASLTAPLEKDVHFVFTNS